MARELEYAEKTRDSNDAQDDNRFHIVLSKHQFKIEGKDGAEIDPVHDTFEESCLVTAKDQAAQKFQGKPNHADAFDVI